MKGGSEEAPDLARLRAAFAQVEDPPEGDGCPTTAEIWDGLHGALRPERLREVVDHLVSCAACAEAWRIGLLLEGPPEAAPAVISSPSAGVAAAARRSGPDAAASSGGHAESELPVVAPLHRWWPRRQPVAVSAAVAAFAAAAALVLVLGIWRYLAMPPAAPVTLRGGEAQAAATRWVTPDGAVLPRREATIRWSGPPQATYDLIFEDTEGQRPPALAAAHGLTAGEYRIPATDLASLPAGAPLHAILTTHLADGTSERIFRNFRLQ
ncbi:MAG TPA: hypothetical protein VKY89_01670 [Thermoanaerobaculia bacterium]|jgi:hypothetical protein|nr:hypothetical protein [Thermoanaerobaculia bacterium]